MHLPVYTHPTPFSFAGDRRTPLWVKSARCGCGCGGDRAYRLPLDHRCARPAGAWSLSREHDVSETPHRTWLAPYDMVTIWGGRMASRARIYSSDSLPPTHRAGSRGSPSCSPCAPVPARYATLSTQNFPKPNIGTSRPPSRLYTASSQLVSNVSRHRLIESRDTTVLNTNDSI